MINSKKGGIADILLIAIAAIVISSVILLCYALAGMLTTEIYSHIDVPTEAQTKANEMVDFYPNYFDSGFVFFIVVLSIATIVMAALVRVHPIFIPIYLLGLIVVIFLCGVFSNVYEEISAVPMLSSYAADLSMIAYAMSILPFFIGIFGTILCVAMYKLWSMDQQR